MACISIPAAAIVGGIASSAIGAGAATSAADTQAQSAQNATNAQLGMFNQGQANVAPWLQAGQGSLAQLQAALGLTGQGAVTRTALGPAMRPGMTATPGAQFRPTPGGGVQQILSTGAAPQPGVGGIPLSAGAGATSPLAQILSQTPGYQWDVSQGQQAIMDQASSMGGVNSGATLKALSDYTSNQAQNTYQSYLQNLFGISNTGANAALGQAGIGAQVGGQIGSNMIGAGNALAAGQIGSANAISGGLGGLYNQYLMSQALQGGGGGAGIPAAAGGFDPSAFGFA
jgi:hypothetical protein